MAAAAEVARDEPRAASRSPRPKGRAARRTPLSAAALAERRRWPGCHVAHRRAPWILGVQDLESAGIQAGDEPLPDISIDPEEKVLSVINTSDVERCYYLSLPAESGCATASGRRLATGTARDADGTVREVITFVLVVGPKKVMDVCELRGSLEPHSVEVQSDIVTLLPPPETHPSQEELRSYGFPLLGPGPFLCSQGGGGRLTHFAHPSTYHAIDLDCPVGTVIVAIHDGRVNEVRDSEQVSGIDVRNFFRWNQVTVLQDDGALAEYVHIQAGSASARVKVGDAVRRGQPICCSGDAGFCPTPHLHLEIHLEEGEAAPSIPFRFQGASGPFRCEEGERYTAAGRVTSSELVSASAA
ncbi:unnamed protein product [Polarella glacialis]|uniref:M23ase beta-sheet core domain-containing protein n=1 Tax=Polarella glacialis TaxID=89957 RepID=A0A813H7L0_POLGL|nr:unnamed protein product [Polarella glacialis]CAE8682042.1 unnamed protein product [Polarella glacialis]